MVSREFFDIFKSIKLRILEEEHEFKELLEEQKGLTHTLKTLIDSSGKINQDIVST